MENAIKRTYNIGNLISTKRVLILYGPRRVGKTTLVKEFLSTTQLKYKFESGENIKIQQVLSSGNFELIKEFVEGYNLLAIDEAQYIPKVGEGLKILIDQIPDLYIIATGSSSFHI